MNAIPPQHDFEGSPWPYSEKQLVELIGHLRIGRRDQNAEFLVGIARLFLDQRRNPPSAAIKAARIRERDRAEAAAQAAKLLKQLVRLYDKKDGLRLFSGLLPLRRFVRDGDAMHVAEALEQIACRTMPALKRGPNTDHVTVALMLLIDVWEDARGRSRGRDAFIKAALEPLGYNPGNKEFERQIKKAKAILSR